MKRLKKKLTVSRTTLRQLTDSGLRHADGGMIIIRTSYCVPLTASCKNSVCNSCYDTDCCLMPTDA